MPTDNKKTTPPKNFENALDELEQLVQEMESGTLVLDDLLGSYKRGAELITYCKNRLKAVEQQVQVLNVDELEPLTALTQEKPGRENTGFNE